MNRARKCERYSHSTRILILLFPRLARGNDGKRYKLEAKLEHEYLLCVSERDKEISSGKFSEI